MAIPTSAAVGTPGRLVGKVALVTGAGSGIGRAVAVRFAEEGARVLAADVSGWQDHVAQGSGGSIVGHHADVSQVDQVADMVETCCRDLGGLDVVVSNAGIAGPTGPRFHEVDIEDFERVHAVNVRGTFLVLRHALPVLMTRGGGSIVVTASVGSFVANPGSSAYLSSKGATLSLARAAAVEYAQDNIRVNAICPGPVATHLLSGDDLDPLEAADLLGNMPMGRQGTPREIANLALFLASDEASFITGAGYIIDGGRHAC